MGPSGGAGLRHGGFSDVTRFDLADTIPSHSAFLPGIECPPLACRITPDTMCVLFRALV